MRRLTALALLLLLISLETALSRGAGGVFAPEQNVKQPSSQALPEPTGAFRVGTLIFQLTDTSRPDPLAKKAGQFRELMVQVWYPTDARAQGETAPYIPNSALVQALKDSQHDSQDPAVFESWKAVRTAGVLNEPLSKKRTRFPLLFFSHGLGEPRSLYTAFSQDLASHGFVVACIDHPYGGITISADGRVVSTDGDPDAGNADATPRQVEAWAKDAAFVLDRMSARGKSEPAALGQFAGRIDLNRIGMLGHSLGGAAALEACRTDPRFKACADLDGAPFGKVTEEGLKRPTLIMRSGPIYSDADLAKRGRTRAQWEEMGRKGLAMWSSLFQKSKDVPVYSIKINGAGHMSYSDAPFIMPDTINRFGGRIIDASRGYEITTHYIRDFFGQYLMGRRSELLDRAKSPYPEVSAERFNL
jgi:pimeloyl-ACP methyl ester carboxylesterase